MEDVMAENVFGNTYHFEKAFTEYFKELDEKDKQFAEFYVAMMNETAKNCTIDFRDGGTVTLVNGRRKNDGTYAQDGDKLTVKGLPQFPEEGTVLESSIDFVQRNEGDDAGVIHIVFRKI